MDIEEETSDDFIRNRVRRDPELASCKGKIHGHDIPGDYCIRCGDTRLEVNLRFKPVSVPITPDPLEVALDRITNGPVSRIHSNEHDCADQISFHFGERKMFGRYLGVIKKLGTSTAYQIFASIKQSKGVRNPAAVFFSNARKELARRTK